MEPPEERALEAVTVATEANSRALARMEQALLGYRSDGRDGLLAKVEELATKVERLENDRLTRDAQLKVVAAIWGSMWGLVTAILGVAIVHLLHM